MEDQQALLEELETELYLTLTGYVTTVTVSPGGSLNGLDYNASVYEVVSLEADGATVAYRYSDDSISDTWQIGTCADVVDAVIDARNTQIERIENIEA